MKIAIANGKDFWAGVMFVAFGLAFMIVAQNYSMGTAVRMGPAYFPTVLGGILAVLGGVILFESFVTRNKHTWRAFTFRPLQFVGGLILGVIAYYTQAFFRGYGIPGDIAHTILAGASIFLLFAAFGDRSLWIVLFAVVLFGYLLKPLGLVLAIGALVIARYSGWVWADPAVGIVGSIVIASWAYTLIRDAGGVLLDVSADKNLTRLIRARIETRGDRVTDLHLWQLGPGHRAAVISLVSDDPLPPSHYKRRLTGLRGLSHVTIEVEACVHGRAEVC